VEVTACTIKSACVVYNYIRKTKTTEITRREEEILEHEQQNVIASVEHAACFGHPSTEALQVREKLKKLLFISSWEMRSTSITYACSITYSNGACILKKSTSIIWGTLAIRKGNVFIPNLHLI